MTTGHGLIDFPEESRPKTLIGKQMTNPEAVCGLPVWVHLAHRASRDYLARLLGFDRLLFCSVFLTPEPTYSAGDHLFVRGSL